ncbi:hypothetical protein SCP_0605740 [Sparassis crispa]|uniref:Uncharacterized protein n=1 Tax=Sparassis crispa TaxID=139825 RepID=A0A401GQW0_9APHY|nr:hypothetical protein SCP_0605740 [Sparassis crispa]GBE84595.1 hypothetical protein SCP_0605740 [Sparassis crispa]
MSEAEVQVPADVFAEAAGDAELAAFVKEVQTAAVDSNKPYALRVMSNGKFLQWTVGPYRGVANAAFKRGAGNFRGHGTNGESAAKTGRFTLVLAPRTVHLVLTDDKGELVFDFTAGGLEKGLDGSYEGRWSYFG